MRTVTRTDTRVEHTLSFTEFKEALGIPDDFRVENVADGNSGITVFLVKEKIEKTGEDIPPRDHR